MLYQIMQRTNTIILLALVWVDSSNSYMTTISTTFRTPTMFFKSYYVPNSRLKASVQESATSKFAGAGPIQVDMNQYNIQTMDEIVSEWTAVVMQATSKQKDGIYLQSKSKDKYLADTVIVSFDRLPNKGLGLQLLELAGGREDGVGITIIENVLNGGCAENSGIIPGDSIIKIDLIKKSKLNKSNNNNNILDLSENQEIISINTECFGYDKTVEAIVSLPPLDEENYTESFEITVKRIRRKPKVIVKLQYPPNQQDDVEDDVTLELYAGENLRRALLVRGVKLNDPLSKRFDSGGKGDCGAEGTCATCAVSIVRGKELLNPPTSTESQIFTKSSPNSRWRMSCKTIVGYGMKEGEIIVRVNPKQWDDEL